MQTDELTAVSLFTVALDGFTYMDVHRSRAECMVRLGDIAKKNGDVLKALELWETAKPLFERSSQAKRVHDIDERVGSISEETKEQHRKNLAHLAELNVPAGKVEEVDSDTEELGLEEEQIHIPRSSAPQNTLFPAKFIRSVSECIAVCGNRPQWAMEGLQCVDRMLCKVSGRRIKYEYQGISPIILEGGKVFLGVPLLN
ncbi:hypothetical protein B0H16DRAFT_1475628 [Mycena metata]|uniref:Uncharacterized protein n=1 Tax=Mycena metata TaxID=1033252 RepID=A0AAD7HE85_9AGAR|nr:hypothetical protein B0H16DRAFT_1475628 [Mycena metata]